MVLVAVAMKAQIVCTGWDVKRNRLCNTLLAKVDVDEFKGTIEIKCPKCNTIAVFR